jgi:Protein of unknown function (DUF5818)
VVSYDLNGVLEVKKSLVVAIAHIVLCCFTLAAPKDQTWNGWVSETACGAKGANAQHAGCAKKCIANGEKPVLVTDKDQKVLSLENPDSLKEHAGEHVKVSGKMTADGTLHVDSVQPLGQ